MYLHGGLVRQLLCACTDYIISSYTLGIHVCYGQSMDLCNPWVVLRKVGIGTFAQKTMDLLPIIIYGWIVHVVPSVKYGLSR